MTSARQPEPPTVRIADAPGLIEAVPYLLGFHPTASVVLVGLHGCQVVVTVRVDLGDAMDGSTLLGSVQAMTRGGTSAIVALIYADDVRWPGPGCPPDPHVAPATAQRAPQLPAVAEAVCRAVDRSGVRLDELLVIDRGRWRSSLGSQADGQDGRGQEIDREPGPVAAAAVLAGLVARSDRAELAAVLDPAPAADQVALRALVAAESARRSRSEVDAARLIRADTRALFARARTGAAASWTPPTDVEVVRLATALRDPAIRDSLWLAVDEHRLDGRPLWQELARRLPAPFNAAPLFLFGWASWRDGNGALAGIAADRAVAGDPDYSAADLLLAALAHGVDPRRMPRLRSRRTV